MTVKNNFENFWKNSQNFNYLKFVILTISLKKKWDVGSPCGVIFINFIFIAPAILKLGNNLTRNFCWFPISDITPHSVRIFHVYCVWFRNPFNFRVRPAGSRTFFLKWMVVCVLVKYFIFTSTQFSKEFLFLFSRQKSWKKKDAYSEKNLHFNMSVFTIELRYKDEKKNQIDVGLFKIRKNQNVWFSIHSDLPRKFVNLRKVIPFLILYY